MASRATLIAVIARRCDETPLKHGAAESLQSPDSCVKPLDS
jgi:hypothetical protein